MKIATYNAYIILDQRRAKTNGTYPLKLRVVVDRKSFHIPLKLSISEKYWKTDKEQISTACKTISNVTKENLRIVASKMHALNVLSYLEEKQELALMSMEEVKAAILDKTTKVKKRVMVLAFGKEIIAELKEAGKVGNARVYQTMLNSVSTFLKKKDIPLQKINYKWLKKYDAWYLGKGNSQNGLALHLRTLRALYNRAIKEYPELKESYPFTQYSIKHEKTRKRAISETALYKLQIVEPQTRRQERAKDYFFMSYYLMGASFIDIAFLTKRNIKNGRIEYKRKKTGQLHSIKISSPLQTLLDKYLEGKITKNAYILNVVKGDTEEQKYTAVRDELRRYNRALKELAELAEIEGEITSYTARHSFATIAKYKGVPVAVISELLRHDSPETTQVYLDSFDNETLDKYGMAIFGE